MRGNSHADENKFSCGRKIILMRPEKVLMGAEKIPMGEDKIPVGEDKILLRDKKIYLVVDDSLSRR